MHLLACSHVLTFFPSKTARIKVNAQTEKWIEDHPNDKGQGIITIPIVVHVVWNTNQENISDTQIESQIEIEEEYEE